MNEDRNPNPSAGKSPSGKRRYVAPKLTLLGREELEAKLKAKSRAGSLEARKLLDWLTGKSKDERDD